MTHSGPEVLFKTCVAMKSLWQPTAGFMTMHAVTCRLTAEDGISSGSQSSPASMELTFTVTFTCYDDGDLVRKNTAIQSTDSRRCNVVQHPVPNRFDTEIERANRLVLCHSIWPLPCPAAMSSEGRDAAVAGCSYQGDRCGDRHTPLTRSWSAPDLRVRCLTLPL